MAIENANNRSKGRNNIKSPRVPTAMIKKRMTNGLINSIRLCHIIEGTVNSTMEIGIHFERFNPVVSKGSTPDFEPPVIGLRSLDQLIKKFRSSGLVKM
jgi:hypothetical protein